MDSDFAAFRVRKDVNDLCKSEYSCPHATTRLDFPDGANNMLRLIFSMSIADVSGPFANGDFTFFVEIPKTYPFHAPKVTCLTRVWHPNIDVATGRVMMAIIGQDWGPVLNISTVLFGLQLIFLEPNISYVLNPTAAEMLHQDPEKFRTDAQRILCGGRFYGYDFPPHPRVIEKQRQGWGLRVKRPRHDESPDASSEWDSMASPNASDILGIEAPEIMENETTPTWKRARFQ